MMENGTKFRLNWRLCTVLEMKNFKFHPKNDSVNGFGAEK